MQQWLSTGCTGAGFLCDAATTPAMTPAMTLAYRGTVTVLRPWETP